MFPADPGGSKRRQKPIKCTPGLLHALLEGLSFKLSVAESGSEIRALFDYRKKDMLVSH